MSLFEENKNDMCEVNILEDLIINYHIIKNLMQESNRESTKRRLLSIEQNRKNRFLQGNRGGFRSRS